MPKGCLQDVKDVAGNLRELDLQVLGLLVFQEACFKHAEGCATLSPKP